MFTDDQMQQLKTVVSECLTRVQSPWMDTQTAAAYAGCSPNSIINAACAGHIRRHKPTDTAMTRYHRDEIDKWIQGKK